MKRLLILMIFVLLCLPGCFGGGAEKMIQAQKDLMNTIPNNEFTKLEIHRGGVYSASHIIVKGAKKDGDTLVLESVDMNLNYGPASFVMSLEGYKRDASTLPIFSPKLKVVE